MYMEHGGEVNALCSLNITPLNIALRDNGDKVVSGLVRLGAHLDAGHDGEYLFGRFVHDGDAGAVYEKATNKQCTHCRETRRRCSAAIALPVRAEIDERAYSAS